MKLTWEALTVDAHDPAACGRWWAETLGWDVVSEEAAGVEVAASGGAGPSLFFVLSADTKAAKNRLHLDLYAEDQPGTVRALLARGARHVDIGQAADADCVVLCDPEGNEFCLLEPRDT